MTTDNFCFYLQNMLIQKGQTVGHCIKWRQKPHQVERGPVKVCILLAHQSGVDVLEDLVESELAHALHRVADGGGGPTKEEVLGAALLERELEPVAQALVLLFVYLLRK